MKNVAVLGYGVVGSGVVEILETSIDNISRKAGDEIRVRKILDIMEFPNDPYNDLIVHDFEEIYNDPSINIVIETIGGTKVAYEYSKRTLMQGRHLVTSNKELVAEHGPELMQIAREKGCRYMFEASVGGGIPIIRPILQCLAANDITSVTGILNGTTNYILTAMRSGDKAFEQALKEAQEKGYAEANPDNDVEGYDACRKIAILSSLAYEKFVDYRDIKVEGISSISSRDFLYAEELGHSIKLIGLSRLINNGSRENGTIEAIVCPMLVPRNSPLYNVDDVMNAILVTGNAVGDAMFYGKGAGKLPTASAVVGDVIDVVRNPINFSEIFKKDGKHNIANTDSSIFKYFVRVNVSGHEVEDLMGKALGRISSIFTKSQQVRLKRLEEYSTEEREIAFVTDFMSEIEFTESCHQLKVSLKNDENKVEIANRIRFLKQ